MPKQKKEGKGVTPTEKEVATRSEFSNGEYEEARGAKQLEYPYGEDEDRILATRTAVYQGRRGA